MSASGQVLALRFPNGTCSGVSEGLCRGDVGWKKNPPLVGVLVGDPMMVGREVGPAANGAVNVGVGLSIGGQEGDRVTMVYSVMTG